MQPLPDTPSKPSRLKRLTGSKKFRYTVATLGVFTLGGTAASALWTDNAEMSQTITAGTVDITLDGAEGNPSPYPIALPLSQFAPGSTTNATVSLKNAGTLGVTVTMATTTTGGVDGLATALDTVITNAPGAGFTGKLDKAALTTFTVAPGATVPVNVEVTAPTDLANTFQGLSDTVTFTFTATQVTP